jgi:hypothetical protein
MLVLFATELSPDEAADRKGDPNAVPHKGPCAIT